MAGFLERMKNVVSGTISKELSGMEARNPEAVYESAIEGRKERAAAMKKQIAALAATLERTREKLEAKERELQRLQPSIEAALAEDADDVALVLLQQKEQAEHEVEELAGQVTSLEAQVSETTEGLRAYRQQLEDLKVEREKMLAQKAQADAQIKMQETLSGLSEDADVRGLSTVREHIDHLHHSANQGMLDEDGNSLRPKVEDLDRRTAQARAQLELKRMKARLGKQAENTGEGEDPTADAESTRTLDSPPAPSPAPSQDVPEDPPPTKTL